MAKVFHGWRMVAAASGIQFLQAGLLHQAFGAYFAVLSEEFRWSKTALSGAAALQPMEAALLGPLLGWIIDRFGSQGMIRLGIVIFGLGFVFLGTIDSLAGFYAAFVIIAFGSSLCGFFPLNVSIIRWFEKKRARALSFVGLGVALGGTLVPVVAWCMQTYGWRATAIGSGLVAIVVGWPLARTFKSRPEDHGETIDGLPVGAPGTGDTEDPPAREFSTVEALRTRAFWLLSLGHGTALMVVYAINVHAITHMKDALGYSLAEASLIITLVTLSQVAGVLVGGVIGDRFDKRRIAALCMLMHGTALAILAYANGTSMLVLFALMHGSAWGLRGPLMQALRADYFGRRAIGMILGISSMIVVIGQMGGPVVAALLADLTGNYRAGFTLLALTAGFGSMFFLLARRPA